MTNTLQERREHQRELAREYFVKALAEVFSENLSWMLGDKETVQVNIGGQRAA